MAKEKTLKQLIIEHDNDCGFCVENIFQEKDDFFNPNSLSVVIPYFETGDVFSLTLKHLYDSIDYIKQKITNKWNYEVIVIDDGSKDKKAKNYIEKKYCNLKIIELEKNLGRTMARNLGLKNSKYEKCLFMDSDILIAEEFLMKNMLVHGFSNEKVITVGFFQFVKKDELNLGENGKIKCSSVHLNDYRISCSYGKTWVGCESDRQFIGKKFKIVEETDYFRKWPRKGFFGPWFLTNMVLGGFFMVDNECANKCNGFDESFQGYGFTETSLPTKLIAGYGHYLIPVIEGGCIHVDDYEINVSREEKDKIFWKKHDFYFNQYLNLTWGEALKGYGKK